MAKPGAPEPKFFLVDDEYRKGLEYYSRKYFAKAGGRQAVGEKSTNYLESSVAASRIREAVPAIKLVFAIRNPLERAYSNYLWSRKNGLETLSFEEAVEREERGRPNTPLHTGTRGRFPTSPAACMPNC